MSGFYEMNKNSRKALEHSGHLISPGLSIGAFADSLRRSYMETEVTSGGSPAKKIKLPAALERTRSIFRRTHKLGGKVIFIGNGGSAAIASHMATDYTKNGGIRSVAFNDAPTLTCMANDFGYENAFAKLIRFYHAKHDSVVCISSSGNSKNILMASCEAQSLNLPLITLSGFDPGNSLRIGGDVNFYVPAGDYGLIEIAHMTLLHTITSVSRLA